MGLEVLQGGMLIGELPADIADMTANPYFGGAPIAMQNTGLTRLAKATDDQVFIGLAQNSSFEDSTNGNCTVVAGNAYVRFIDGSVSQDEQPSTQPTETVEGAPYDTTLTFVPGDKLYIAASGLWTNVAAAGKEKGIVTKGNTSADDAVEAIMYPSNLRATA